MRGVITFFFTIFIVVVMMLVGPPLLEGVGEEVKKHPTVDQQGQDTIDDMYTAVFVWAPMVLVFGMGVWGVGWYIIRHSSFKRKRVR